MREEVSQAVVGDSVASALEENPGERKRRFGWRRKPKKEVIPLTHCENCETELRGHYCSNCGQAAVNYHRSFRHVIVDVLDSFLNWDSKFIRTIGLLLWRPGWLTNQFVDGRRVRFLHPLRLYLLVSIAFFLCAKLIPVGSGQTTKVEDMSPETRARFEEKMEKVRKKQRANAFFHITSDQDAETKAPYVAPAAVAQTEAMPAAADAALDEVVTEVTAQTGGKKQAPHLTFGKNKDGAARTPFENWMEKRIIDRIGEGGTKAKLFIETLRSNLSTMMLFCIPVFAFVLKILYLRQKRFYIEHLVYALNIHAFFYLAVLIVVFISWGLNKWIPGTPQVLLTISLCFLVAAQVFLSIRRVYRQSWLMTTVKFVVGGFIYVCVIAMAIGATAFVTLMLPD
ncbi:MAG: hypothetical protein QOH88_698 [Verrucomicrobiota bacterium]|jgi:hypothetical protein